MTYEETIAMAAASIPLQDSEAWLSASLPDGANMAEAQLDYLTQRRKHLIDERAKVEKLRTMVLLRVKGIWTHSEALGWMREGLPAPMFPEAPLLCPIPGNLTPTLCPWYDDGAGTMWRHDPDGTQRMRVEYGLIEGQIEVSIWPPPSLRGQDANVGWKHIVSCVDLVQGLQAADTAWNAYDAELVRQVMIQNIELP